MVKNTIRQLIILLFLFFSGCNNNNSARSDLEQARSLYEAAQYGSARQQLAELKERYPKAYDIQKEAIRLMREIEWKEQERNLVFCDSMLLVRQMEADSMKQYFVFEKTGYDLTGRYTDKSWNPPVETASTCIKTSITEPDEIVLTAVCKGSYPIQYNQLKASVPSGEYAETQAVPFDGGANYSFRDGSGINYQIVTFQKGRDNGVISFIYTYINEKITVEYTGGGGKSSHIPFAKEKEALVRTVDLAVIFKDIERLKKEKDKAGKRIQYLQSKI
jgi:hypothetical protein